MAPHLKHSHLIVWLCFLSILCLPVNSKEMSGMQDIGGGVLDGPVLNVRTNRYPPYQAFAVLPTSDFSRTQPPPDDVGEHTIYAGVFGVVGLGVFMAIGILLCRLCITAPHPQSPVNKDLVLFKPAHSDAKRHLENYNRIRLSTSGNSPDQGDIHGPDDIPADHYYADVMHTSDVMMVNECAPSEPCYMNVGSAPRRSTSVIAAAMTNGLVSADNTRVE